MQKFRLHMDVHFFLIFFIQFVYAAFVNVLWHSTLLIKKIQDEVFFEAVNVNTHLFT